MLTGNKGEWSEPYALLKLIADKKIFMGGKNFTKLPNVFYPILKVIRNEKKRDLEFSYDSNIVIISNENPPLKIPISEFIDMAKLCFQKIKKAPKGKGVFNIPEIEEFLNTFSINTLKAKSKKKNDITIQIEDNKSLFAPTLGFSLKSQLGKPSTLVNASRVTNFTYAIQEKVLTLDEISNFNNIEKFSDKISYLKTLGASIKFLEVENETFNINLQTIDYNFPKILADVVYYFYENNISSENTVRKFIQKIAQQNPFQYNLKLNPDIYQMIMKRFLSDYALGMRAGEVWKRDIQANGGYLIVREDGEIICYHFYFVKNFEEFLFDNTKLETPDKRNEFGSIYEENGFQKLKLNLQIRFIK